MCIRDSAKVAILAKQRGPNIEHIIKTFNHNKICLLYTSIESNIKRSLFLADKTAFNYYKDLAEKGYYNPVSYTHLMRTELEFYAYDRRDYCNTIGQIVASIPSDKSIFLLGRYSFDDYYLSFMYQSIIEGNRLSLIHI